MAVPAVVLDGSVPVARENRVRLPAVGKEDVSFGLVYMAQHIDTKLHNFSHSSHRIVHSKYIEFRSSYIPCCHMSYCFLHTVLPLLSGRSYPAVAPPPPRSSPNIIHHSLPNCPPLLSPFIKRSSLLSSQLSLLLSFRSVIPPGSVIPLLLPLYCHPAAVLPPPPPDDIAQTTD